MRILVLWIFLFYALNYGFSQNNLPDWIASRPSPANVGYVASVVIPINWPISIFGEITTWIENSPDVYDNVIIEVYDSSTPRQLKNTLSFSGTYGINPAISVGVQRLDSLVYKAINQSGFNDCASISGKDLLNVDDGTFFFNDYKCVGTIVLPITFLKQPAAIIQKYQTQIIWSVATQLNNEKYIIEHSKDGRNFSPIGEIAGDGTSYETKHYEYMHTSPYIGINYYRIKQVDYDGNSSYSDIVSVRYDGDHNINIYPNPTTSEVTITTSEPSTIQIIDVYGRLLNTQDISEGQNTINVSELPTGILIFAVGNQRFKVLKE
ncbi:MAG TPA: T9SS type A sorting domain-containing protein [Saprospiraceae bacterium]|jgi:hypothetical protein|nr:T9SS type A sorting domain-containing protein [Saprospiraceae bacterium]HMT71465.1 T9SS type A sorting domain-containing protein [Saprospiraceae bacterium]